MAINWSAIAAIGTLASAVIAGAAFFGPGLLDRCKEARTDVQLISSITDVSALFRMKQQMPPSCAAPRAAVDSRINALEAEAEGRRLAEEQRKAEEKRRYAEKEEQVARLLAGTWRKSSGMEPWLLGPGCSANIQFTRRTPDGPVYYEDGWGGSMLTVEKYERLPFRFQFPHWPERHFTLLPDGKLEVVHVVSKEDPKQSYNIECGYTR
jgi:hypothetical protein